MRYDAHISVYDVLDEVWIAYTVVETSNELPPTSRQVLKGTVQQRGEGHSDPSRWLLDALVAAAETL